MRPHRDGVPRSPRRRRFAARQRDGEGADPQRHPCAGLSLRAALDAGARAGFASPSQLEEPTMPVHFSASEMSARKQRLIAAMAERRLDGMLLFAQESDYWLTGYDTFGFCFFQCLYVGADGRVAALPRSPDLRQARHTSNIED